MEAILNFIQDTGFYMIGSKGDWQTIVMILISFVLMYLAIVKKFEPLLLLPISFGMLATNLPGAEMYHEILFAGGHIHWELFGGSPMTAELLSELQASGVSESGVSSGGNIAVPSITGDPPASAMTANADVSPRLC